MTSSILLTGGTGTLGRLVAPLLRDAGSTVRVLSRRNHEPADGIQFVTGDLATGAGVQAAVDGVDTIVHCAGNAKGDEETTRTLVEAASAAGAPHLVFISVVGADRVPVVSRVDRAMFGYLASKRAAEHVVAGSGLPWTTLRATQFHDLALTTARQLAKLPVIPGPGRFPDPTDRHRGRSDSAGRARLGRAGRPSARHRRTAGVRVEGADPQLPASRSPAPDDRAGPVAGPGRPSVPGWREPRPRPGRRRRTW
ncbi:MAG: SDR family oxidoreductase [Sporichthyaceae bacterium]|nr:SDR family oxidoreductase [Sporichthyaceae bacterium]